MKITQIGISTRNQSQGLVQRRFQVRTDVVLLVGKNGSGKTRLLDYIIGTVGREHTNRNYIMFDNAPKITISNTSKNSKQRQQNMQRQKEALLDRMKLIKGNQISNLQRAISKQEKSYQDVLASDAQALHANEIELLNRSALQYWQNLPHRLTVAQVKYGVESRSYFNTKVYREFIALKGLLKDFIDKDLHWEMDDSKVKYDEQEGVSNLKGKWKLNDWDFIYEKLSDGEKTLFAYSLLLHIVSAQKRSRLSETILLLDEPELHLHPESQIKLINSLKSILSENGQLWIATHSLVLISQFSYREIFILDDGQVRTPNSLAPLNAVEQLLGIEDRLANLSDFLSNTYIWTFTNFILQCFQEPDSVAVSPSDDPQFAQFLDSIRHGSQQEILDYGAGQGRIGRLLLLNNTKSLELKALDAYEPKEEYREQIPSNAYTNIYGELNEIKTKYDYVILSNTLHEINPELWDSIFISIKGLLKDDGFLIFMEDLEIPNGEKIEPFGYLVLNENEIGALFDIDLKNRQSETSKYSDRLVCTAIPRKSIKKIDDNSLIMALEKAKVRCLKNSKQLRETNEPRTARKLAFYTTLYLNCDIALEHFRARTVPNKR